MKTLSQILIGFVALEHVYILWMEMFAWTTRGPKAFKSLPASLFEPTKALAANQGLYNCFLVAGLVWTYFITDITWSSNIACFFPSCVLVAGIYGWATASKSILYIQAIPAAIALAVTIIARL